MKGIVLAAGTGSRLFPTTLSTNKHLLPIYDKPMIFYPLSVLMLADIRDILIITSELDKNKFKSILGEGQGFGINIEYEIQQKPQGIADAINIASDFIGNDDVTLILGDNFFYGQGFVEKLEEAKGNLNGATVFGYQASNPENFGVMEISNNKILSLTEKPKKPKSKWVATGLYMFENSVKEKVKDLKPSTRNELEITDLNNIFLKEEKLSFSLLGRGFAWLDTGTPDSLLEASEFVRTIEKRQGLKIACLEEIALNKNWISKTQVLEKISHSDQSEYLVYLKNMINKQ